MLGPFLQGGAATPGALRSAYAAYGPDGEPPFTSYNYRRQWTIDYIFHSRAVPCVHVPRAGGGVCSRVV